MTGRTDACSIAGNAYLAVEMLHRPSTEQCGRDYSEQTTVRAMHPELAR